MKSPRLLLAGPAGVGKSTIARSLSDTLAIDWIDFDAVRARLRETGEHLDLSRYDFADTAIGYLPAPPAGVVLDVGGDSVFRERADYSARLAQVQRLKADAALVVVLLAAEKEVVRERYMNCGKPSSGAAFDSDWESWLTHMQPYWARCADREVHVNGSLSNELIQTVAFG